VVERSDNTGFAYLKKLLGPRPECKNFWSCRRSRSSNIGYRLRCLRQHFDQNLSFTI